MNSAAAASLVAPGGEGVRKAPDPEPKRAGPEEAAAAAAEGPRSLPAATSGCEGGVWSMAFISREVEFLLPRPAPFVVPRFRRPLCRTFPGL